MRRVPTVITNTEAAAGLDSVIDSGIEHSELIPETTEEFVGEITTSFGEAVDEILPQYALLLVASRYGLNRRRGMSHEGALDLAKSEAGRVMAVSIVASAVAALTGIDGVRFGVVVAGGATEVALSKMDAETSASTARISSRREVIAAH